jgi:lysine 2,3-aminomutase
MKVKPYYLYQCDLIKGSSHLRTDVQVGIDIIKGLRGHTSGYAIPQFVIDSPNGGGKIPISPNYTTFERDGSIVLENYAGKNYKYPSINNSTANFIE